MRKVIVSSTFLPLLIAGIALLAACESEPTSLPESDAIAPPEAHIINPTPEAEIQAPEEEAEAEATPTEADDDAEAAPAGEVAAAGIEHLDLARAASAGELENVVLYIRLGADVNAANDAGVAPLHSARTAEIAEALIEAGADLEVQTGALWTPLHYAIIRARGDVAETLLDKGADPNMADSAGMTPLFHAVSRGNLAMTRLLVENGADLAAQDQTGWTPLHHAAQSNQVEVAAYLLDQGADIHARSHGGGQPIHEAIGTSKEMFDLLVAKGADVNSKTNEDKTALDYALEMGDENTVEILRSHGAE